MKIQITLSIDGDEIRRNYVVDDDMMEKDWNPVIEDMSDTILNKSKTFDEIWR